MGYIVRKGKEDVDVPYIRVELLAGSVAVDVHGFSREVAANILFQSAMCLANDEDDVDLSGDLASILGSIGGAK